jgi:hypothetical protein
MRFNSFSDVVEGHSVGGVNRAEAITSLKKMIFDRAGRKLQLMGDGKNGQTLGCQENDPLLPGRKFNKARHITQMIRDSGCKGKLGVS